MKGYAEWVEVTRATPVQLTSRPFAQARFKASSRRFFDACRHTDWVLHKDHTISSPLAPGPLPQHGSGHPRNASSECVNSPQGRCPPQPTRSHHLQRQWIPVLCGRCRRHPRPLCPPAKANKAHNLGAHFLMAQRSAPEWQMQKASLPLICKTNSAPNIYSHQNTAMYSSHEWRIKRASPFVCLCEPAHMIAYTHARALLHSHINAHTRIHTHLTYAEPRNNQ